MAQSGSRPGGENARKSSTQVGGSYNAQGQYQGGHWIDIDYGRPILRGRKNIFEEGGEFGQRIYAGAPIWRIGADPSTRFSTGMDLMFGAQRLPAGEYSIFADLKPGEWTLVFSNYGAKQTPREDTPNTLWGGGGAMATRLTWTCCVPRSRWRHIPSLPTS